MLDFPSVRTVEEARFVQPSLLDCFPLSWGHFVLSGDPHERCGFGVRSSASLVPIDFSSCSEFVNFSSVPVVLTVNSPAISWAVEVYP